MAQPRRRPNNDDIPLHYIYREGIINFRGWMRLYLSHLFSWLNDFEKCTTIFFLFALQNQWENKCWIWIQWEKKQQINQPHWTSIIRNGISLCTEQNECLRELKKKTNHFKIYYIPFSTKSTSHFIPVPEYIQLTDT